MQGLGVKSDVIYADLGYRGVDKDNPGVEIKHRGKDKRLKEDERRLLKRRQSIEPIIGTSRPIIEWTAATSRALRGMRYMPCCVRRATTSVGCCG